MTYALNKLKFRFFTLLIVLFINCFSLEASTQQENKESSTSKLNNSNMSKDVLSDEVLPINEKTKIIYFKNIKNILEKNNEELRILRSKIKQSEAILKSRKAAWSPNLDLNSNELPKYSIGESSNDSSGDTSTNQLTTGINATLKLDIYNPARKSELKIAEDNLKNDKLFTNPSLMIFI